MRYTVDDRLANAFSSANGVPAAFSKGVKRAFDLVVATSMLVLCLPLLALVAIAIKIEDGGPVLHRRRVVGRLEDFNALKFRSMRVDADEWLMEQPDLYRRFQENFKLSSDPRVTRIGKLLRRTSLDELPQLANVISGQMSLVGPRMITRPELAKYGACSRVLLRVRPGMTGFWQVFGHKAGGYDERVQMDMFYVRNWSLKLDAIILLRTPLRVLRGQAEV